MPKEYVDTGWWCELCEEDTTQTIYDSEHERDSSNDWRICHKCKGRYSGHSGEWKQYEENKD